MRIYLEEDSNNEPSFHEKMQAIEHEDEADRMRKKQLSRRISVGDKLFKSALITAFAGFWIFWLIVVLVSM